jgi:hypothetical protein
VPFSKKKKPWSVPLPPIRVLPQVQVEKADDAGLLVVHEALWSYLVPQFGDD